MTQDCVNCHKKLDGYLARKCMGEADETDIVELKRRIEEGKKDSNTLCEYVDWLLSTYNPNPPDQGSWIKPDLHPCQWHHKDVISEHSDNDYVDLLNMVQRHSL